MCFAQVNNQNFDSAQSDVYQSI